jgi:Holliday junction resolvasome RuvABC ATP-dependent DNA helicase subunit
MSAVRGLSSFVGQTASVNRLAAFAKMILETGNPAWKILLVGPDGIGKKTVAAKFAEEMGSPFHVLHARSVLATADLTSALTNLRDRQVLFVEAINELKSPFVHLLLTAAENQVLDIVIGTGPLARTHCIDLCPFMLFASAPSHQSVEPATRKHFDLVLRFESYTEQEMNDIVLRIAGLQEVEIEPAAVDLLVGASARTPALAESLLKKVARMADGKVTSKATLDLLNVLGMSSQTSQVRHLPLSLSGPEFEVYVTELLRRMGFTAETTKATGDGGIDIVAGLEAPILGGKYLFQCKCYSEGVLVGVSAVRDFYGTVTADQQAVKGVMITTSDYTNQAKEFAAQVNVELIDGEQLQRLVDRYVEPNHETRS